MPEQGMIAYHQRRARQELERGLAAASPPAARAHLQLASLHMGEVSRLAGQTQLTRPALAS